ncbi:carboxymuconolactone decarboxylase family protein [Methanocella sp. CWC-04]|uniref:Carboxymuconolactone decarboxylase family protein n=1 Tax=Methanooceanicella nereidis TaxID=2052831 RepID=A0AAP2RF87_9EURY|nr:carboxymuconolactone decarboxylase family protein [Methanocella sp. CWC-04]MCD1295746.1 carboxymuconolactone decarboxylase family protein [Methanocella sp. CWC-04]
MKFENTLKNIFGKEPEDAVNDLLKNIENDYGEIPFILKAMSDKPNVLLPKMIYDDAVLRNPEHLDERTVELISIAVATSLKCDHCLNMHLRVARRKGIKEEEMFEAILLASAFSNTAALAQAMRVFENHKNETKAQEELSEYNCKSCVVYENNNHTGSNGNNNKDADKI